MIVVNWKDYFNPSQVYIERTPSIINRSGLSGSKYSANTYVGCPHACMYCYVPAMKHGPADGAGKWGTYLGVKEWTPLTTSVTKKLVGSHLIIGSSTDPYNPLEPHFRKTRTLLQELQGTPVNLSVITKSDLVLQDVDILSSFDNAMVCVSINTLDEKFKEDVDAAPSIKSRIATLARCKDMGLITSCFISPVFPVITNTIEIIEAVKFHCDSIWVDSLNLQKANLGRVTGYISMEYSDIFPLYRRIFRDGDLSFWSKESEQIQIYARKNAMPYSNGKLSVERAPLGKPTIVDSLPLRVRK